jgi:hypothetical protein
MKVKFDNWWEVLACACFAGLFIYLVIFWLKQHRHLFQCCVSCLEYFNLNLLYRRRMEEAEGVDAVSREVGSKSRWADSAVAVVDSAAVEAAAEAEEEVDRPARRCSPIEGLWVPR